ncbi:MAG: phage tail tape measure protein, partial [Clostridia bacterium]|nr:phage tail tape measure protein [Clostridia bacterium]
MANRIKGITVEIGGDTTKLSKALKNVDSSIKSTQTQLRDVNKLLKLDPGNTELLAQKHRLLGDAVGQTKQRLETLKTAAEQADKALAAGDIS